MADAWLKFLLLCVCILVPLTIKGVYGECANPPQNLAVFEGAVNTTFTCNSPTKGSYAIKPTSDPIGTYKITNNDDNVTTTLRNLYAVNSTSLIVKIAQGTAATPPISTAGLYGITYNGSTTPLHGAKLVVVRGLPTCNTTAMGATKLRKNCTLTYADGINHPINAIMTWTSNGTFYANDTPVRTKVGAYYVSKSSIVINVTDPTDYRCIVTLAIPTNIQFAYVATNAPEFCATCTSAVCDNAATTTEPPTTTQPLPTTEPPTTTEAITTTKPPTTTQPEPTTEPLTTTEPIPTTEPPTTTEPIPTTEPPTTTEPIPTTEPPTTTEPVPTTEPPTTTEPVPTTEPPTTTEPIPTTEPPTTTEPIPTTGPLITTEPIPTEEPTTTTEPIPTTEPPTTTLPPTTTECNCEQTTTACPSVGQNCTQATECQSDELNWMDVYNECVVKAELYVRSDNCCPGDLVCGVVVTLRNDSRLLIHDRLCDDNRCDTVVFDASCMSSDWKLLAERKITISGVGDNLQAGYIDSFGPNMTDCSESCRRMMNLP